MYESDVVVVGAGPAGSAAAREISAEGYNVFLVEKDAYPGENNVCAGCISQPCAESLDLAEEIIEKRISKAVYYFPWKTYVQSILHVTVLRSVFDRFLAEKAVKKGAKLLVSTLAFDVTRSQDEIVVNLKNRVTGEKDKVKAKLAIFADGPTTLASKKFRGIGFQRDQQKALAAIYDIEWRNNPFEHLEVFFDRNVSPWGYGWIFPKKDWLNVGVDCSISKMRGNIRTYLDFLVDKHPAASRNLHGRRKLTFAASIIPLAHAKRIYDDRVLVVGDAGGMVDPLWGGGIGYAIKGGMLAAEVALKALKEDCFDETSLSQFQKEWKKGKAYKLIRKVQLALELFNIYSRFDEDAYFRLHHLLALKGRAYKVDKMPTLD